MTQKSCLLCGDPIDEADRVCPACDARMDSLTAASRPPLPPQVRPPASPSPFKAADPPPAILCEKCQGVMVRGHVPRFGTAVQVLGVLVIIGSLLALPWGGCLVTLPFVLGVVLASARKTWICVRCHFWFDRA